MIWEKEVLQMCDSPFVMKIYATFQDPHFARDTVHKDNLRTATGYPSRCLGK